MLLVLLMAFIAFSEAYPSDAIDLRDVWLPFFPQSLDSVDVSHALGMLLSTGISSHGMIFCWKLELKL